MDANNNGPLDLSSVLAPISDAASAEHQARDKWVRAAKAAFKAGVRVAMLIKGTEKAPNPQFDETVHDTIRMAVVQGVSAAKKGLKFETPNASGQKVWTVAELVALKGDALRSIEDDILKTQRRTYLQLIDGPMMSRLREHLDRIENPDKPRGKKDAGAKTETATDPTPMHGALRQIRAITAGLATLKGSEDKGLSARDQATLADKLTESAAILAQYCK